MQGYTKRVDKDKNVFYKSKKLCPFKEFEKCIGEECALYSITGFENKEGNKINYGDCALFKLPMLLINIRNIRTGEKQ